MNTPNNPFKRFQLGGATEQQLLMLEAALRQAPLLRERVNDAKDGEKPDLVSITAHDGESPMAHYSRQYREISFSRELLNGPINKENIDKLVDTWMHEIEHARNGQYMAQFNATSGSRSMPWSTNPDRRMPPH